MPPTRSDIRESRRKRLLNTRPVPANRPTWDAEWLDKVIPASELGKPFKDLYAEDNEIEYDLPLDITIPTPTDARPPPLKLSDLECLKTLGESHCKVLLVRSTRKSHRFDSDYPFALKAIPRKHVRENAVRLALEVSNSNQEISQAQKTYLLKSHKKEKEGEISILAKLNWHPFITGLINTFHDSQNLYLGLEYAPHGTLRSLLQQGRMNPRDANFYFANILAAVDFLHIQGIVHRDVKPENILLNSDGYLCLTDFGSACWLDAIDDDFPNMCGTRAYTAPEWHETDLDPRLLDWWSCGCILFEMATGKVAFFKKEISSGLTWPANARVGQNLKDLIERLLDADPTNRLGYNGASNIATHPWLSSIDWEKMLGRHYLPPFIPKPVKSEELWHKYALPEQRVVPGLRIVQPRIHLENDDRFPKKWDY